MAETKHRPLPPAFQERGIPFRLVVVVVVPTILGAVAGALLAPVVAVYIVIQVLAAVGGLFAGLEHRSVPEAIVRGMTAGFCFGSGILVAHVLVGGTDHQLLGQNPLLLPWLTGAFGAIFGIVGSLVRKALE